MFDMPNMLCAVWKRENGNQDSWHAAAVCCDSAEPCLSHIVMPKVLAMIDAVLSLTKSSVMCLVSRPRQCEQMAQAKGLTAGKGGKWVHCHVVGKMKGPRIWGLLGTSMEDAKVRLTMAATMATDPRWHGLRKCTESTLAVTQGPPATDFAARPAQMSIQLSTCHTISNFKFKLLLAAPVTCRYLNQGSPCHVPLPVLPGGRRGLKSLGCVQEFHAILGPLGDGFSNLHVCGCYV